MAFRIKEGRLFLQAVDKGAARSAIGPDLEHGRTQGGRPALAGERAETMMRQVSQRSQLPF